MDNLLEWSTMSLELEEKEGEERLYSIHRTVAIILIPFPFIFLHPAIKNIHWRASQNL